MSVQGQLKIQSEGLSDRPSVKDSVRQNSNRVGMTPTASQNNGKDK
jgi:hypothetical protein